LPWDDAPPIMRAMETFSSGGFKIAYDDIAPPGQAQGTVVLVHGFATNRTENWKRLGWYTAFERKGFRVVALDHRGHGESEKPHDPAAYDRGAMAQDVLNLMDHLGLGRVELMGYSMGAHLSLAIARDHPDRVANLIVGGIGGRMLPGAPPREGPMPNMTLPEALAVDDPAKISDPTMKGFRLFADQQGDDKEALAACSQGRGGGITPEELGRLRVPTLVVAGSWDQLAGDPQALADAIPGAKAVTLPGVDHFSAIPHALYKAAVFDFLEGWMDEMPEHLR
jgi:pimeloyl-ACP methyl ester carboxylesterase